MTEHPACDAKQHKNALYYNVITLSTYARISVLRDL